MRIDPSVLFNPQPAGADTLAEARALLSTYGIERETAEKEKWLEHVVGLLHLPHFWHIEEDGWLLGGFRSFSESLADNYLAEHVFVCKNGFAAELDPDQYTQALEHARGRQETSVARWLNEWLGEDAPSQHYRAATWGAPTAISPFSTRTTDRHLNLSIDDFPGPHNSARDMVAYPFGLLPRNPFIVCRERSTALFSEERVKLATALFALIKKQHTQTMEALQARLPGEAWAAARRFKEPDLSLVAWLSQGNSRYRIQAMELGASPLEELVYYYNNPVPDGHPIPGKEQKRWAMMKQLEEDIDAGREWMTQAAAIIGMDDVLELHTGAIAAPILLRGFRRLAKMESSERPYWCSNETFFHLDRVGFLVLVILGTLEKKHIPQSDHQWMVFSSIARSLFEQLNRNGRSRLANYQKIMKGFWDQPGTKGFSISFENLGEIESITTDAHQWMVQALESVLTLGILDEVSHLLFEHLTLKQWKEMSEVLHRYHDQATERVATNRTEKMRLRQEDATTPLWPACLPERFSHDQVTLAALLNPTDLLKEGKEMKHCVAGYVYQCCRGESRIYAMSNEETGERATLELQLAPNTLEVFCKQLQGPHNELPAACFEQAKEAFLAHIDEEDDCLPWPLLPVPKHWAETGVRDAIFHRQAYDWLAHRHPRLVDRILQHTQSVAPAP